MSGRITIAAEKNDEGLRADAFLARHGDLSRSAYARLIEEGKVTDAEGKPIQKRLIVKNGESFTIDLPVPIPDGAVPEDIEVEVIYEDEDLIVVNKPRGLVTHPSAGHDSGTLVNALLHICKGRLSGIGGVERPGIVHRLDKDTSGLIVCAKNDFTHAALSDALSRHEVERIYQAVLVGTPELTEGSVSAPIGRSSKNRLRMAVSPDGRQAVTHYRLLAKYRGYSHVECKLETGRTHQIRVHMSHIGHPVLGDSLYGAGNNPFGFKGQCLHAGRLNFVHPRSGKSMEFAAELPDCFRLVLKQLTISC